MRINYRFSINGKKVNPIYDDNLEKVYTVESGQIFHRASISGKFKLVGADFDYIKNEPFKTKFILLIETAIDGVYDSVNNWTGKFFKTDCTWDDDNRIVDIKLDTLDQYTDVLNGLEREYNLIKLSPVKTRIEIIKRPLIQVYNPGDDVVSCFIGGVYWEQQVQSEVLNEVDLVNKYYFSLASTLNKISIFDDGAFNDYAGDYAREGTYNTTKPFFAYGRNKTYKVEYVPIGQVNNAGQIYKFRIVRASDSIVLFESAQYYTRHYSPVDTEYTLSAVGGGATGTVKLFWHVLRVYMRYVLDVDYINDIKTYPIPADDFVGNNRNYKRAIGYAIDNITLNANTSIEPTEYGLADDGTYFMPPYSVYGNKFYPVARSTWGMSSIWFNFGAFDFLFEEKGFKTYELKDAVLISDAIRTLLHEIAPNISHEATTEYSEFFYSGVNPISTDDFRLFISQKSNILAGQYDTPAQKAMIRLSDITNMLRDVFKCYWFIEDNKFKIEHIYWFARGGSYANNDQVTADLTTLTDLKLKKEYGFNTSSYKYDKPDLTQRFEFSWMDDVTEGFDGYPIVVNSEYVRQDKIDKINIGKFTTDIDYMLLNPNACSPDGFALFAGKFDTDEQIYKLQFKDFRVDGADLRLQNGLLSWIYIHANFWIYNMPSYDISINNSLAFAKSIERKKKQQVEYPSIVDPDTIKLVRTHLGFGKIDKMTITLSTRYNKIELSYDTE